MLRPQCQWEFEVFSGTQFQVSSWHARALRPLLLPRSRDEGRRMSLSWRRLLVIESSYVYKYLTLSPSAVKVYISNFRTGNYYMGTTRLIAYLGPRIRAGGVVPESRKGAAALNSARKCCASIEALAGVGPAVLGSWRCAAADNGALAREDVKAGNDACSIFDAYTSAQEASRLMGLGRTSGGQPWSRGAEGG